MTDSIISQLPWLIARVSGLVALGLMLLLGIGGIGHITGLTYKFIEPVKAWIIHKWLGIMLAVMVCIHIAILLIDSYLPFSLVDILVPFHKIYANVAISGSMFAFLAIPSAIIAVYLTAWILISSLTQLKRNKVIWSVSHKLSYAVIVLVLLHVLYAGTEFKNSIVQMVLAGCAALLTVLFVARLFRSATLKA
ncbi:MAG TPA: ferric reductase-like transmembrane domain-containing protein [Candidatus Saccharibacteria bacterium]|nr:ferric reductase-like transmembrane domain-containing protein [Candidatus Saccharibacteria bacterium]